MADQELELDVLHDLMEEADIVGRLAADEKTFLSLSAAFQAGNQKAYQEILQRLGLIRHCELVCEWFRIKHSVLLCLRLCGPPPVITRPPNPRTLAQAFVRVTSDEKAVQRLAAAIEKGDAAAFKRIVKEYKLEPICHLFCHWVCHIHYRLICRWVCHPELRERPNLAAELRTAGASAARPARAQDGVRRRGHGVEQRQRRAARQGARGRGSLPLLPLHLLLLLQLALRARLPPALPHLPGGGDRGPAEGVVRLRQGDPGARAEPGRAREAERGRGCRRRQGVCRDRRTAPAAAVLHPAVPLAVLPALPAVLHPRLPAAVQPPVVHARGRLRHLRGHRPGHGPHEQARRAATEARTSASSAA